LPREQDDQQYQCGEIQKVIDKQAREPATADGVSFESGEEGRHGEDAEHRKRQRHQPPITGHAAVVQPARDGGGEQDDEQGREDGRRHRHHRSHVRIDAIVDLRECLLVGGTQLPAARCGVLYAELKSLNHDLGNNWEGQGQTDDALQNEEKYCIGPELRARISSRKAHQVAQVVEDRRDDSPHIRSQPLVSDRAGSFARKPVRLNFECQPLAKTGVGRLPFRVSA
jgi:hypothetical protein